MNIKHGLLVSYGLFFLVSATDASADRSKISWTDWNGKISIQKMEKQEELQGAPANGAASNEETGPAAALELERSLRGRTVNESAKDFVDYDGQREHMYYPDAQPVPVDPKSIVEMTPDFWTQEQLILDFQKNGLGKAGFIVVLKTEYCHKNKFRSCSVTTAILNKSSASLLSKFRVYGAWLGVLNPKSSDPAYAEWQQKVAQTYEFNPGPGANIYVVIPGEGEMVPVLRSDSTKLGLNVESFESNSGASPSLEAMLQYALTQAGK